MYIYMYTYMYMHMYVCTVYVDYADFKCITILLTLNALLI